MLRVITQRLLIISLHLWFCCSLDYGFLLHRLYTRTEKNHNRKAQLGLLLFCVIALTKTQL